MPDAKTAKVTKSDSEWRKDLTPMQYAVLREKATEQPFSGEYEHERREGTYVCAGCGQTLFESETKFDSGCGWPSFTAPEDRLRPSAAMRPEHSSTGHCLDINILFPPAPNFMIPAPEGRNFRSLPYINGASRTCCMPSDRRRASLSALVRPPKPPS